MVEKDEPSVVLPLPIVCRKIGHKAERTKRRIEKKNRKECAPSSQKTHDPFKSKLTNRIILSLFCSMFNFTTHYSAKR